jgi:hypothetical protein
MEEILISFSIKKQPATFEYIESNFKSKVSCTVDLDAKKQFSIISAFISEEGKRILSMQTVSMTGPDGEDYLNSPPPEMVEHFRKNNQIQDTIEGRFNEEGLFSYLKFTPDYYSLEAFSDPQQILPLGVKGEGLFQELHKINSADKKRNLPKSKKI